MMERLIHLDGEPMPPINPGEVVRVTPNFHVVTDYKPGLEGRREGERFYIEPLNRRALVMMWNAAMAHNIYNFDIRLHPYSSPECTEYNPALRADYSAVNIPVLFQGAVQIPEKGKDTIPSPDRMEVCLSGDPMVSREYTFSDELPPSFGIPNPQTRYLRFLQATHSDDIPDQIIGSGTDNSWYKVRKGWWAVLGGRLGMGVADGEFTDPSLIEEISAFRLKYSYKSGFIVRNHRTEAVHIAEANTLIDKIWEIYGNM